MVGMLIASPNGIILIYYSYLIKKTIFGIFMSLSSGKTGWVPNNKRSHTYHGNLWSIVTRNHKELCVVTLDSPELDMRFSDTSTLVDWTYQMIEKGIPESVKESCQA